MNWKKKYARETKFSWLFAHTLPTNVCAYFIHGCQTGNERTISSGSFVLSMRRSLTLPIAQRCVAIGFDPDGMALICQPEGSEVILRLPIQDGMYTDLMDELAALQALPIFSLPIPFSLAT